MTLSTIFCADTDLILSDWQETFSVFRRPVQPSYDTSGQVVDNWLLVGTFVGDWQPITGSAMRVEVGLEIKSDAIIIAPCGIDVAPNDNILRLIDGTYWYVNYVRTYEDHLTIYLRRAEGQAAVSYTGSSWQVLPSGIPSNPPSGMCKVTNIYVNPIGPIVVVLYDSIPVP